ncbi:MAG: peptidase [Actinomycetales bacterium]|nr:peptidase [Actinomycetales bacterium]
MGIEVSAFSGKDRSLAGFLLSGRWPATTREWTQFLAIAVRFAAMPGLLPTTTVFRAVEELPEDPQPDTVGLITSAGPVLGSGAPRPGQFADPQPAALIVLHPPAETRPSTPEAEGAASGCVLLPGVPHLGLDHRAGWVEAEADGTVTRLISRVGVDLSADPDIAVLATLCA